MVPAILIRPQERDMKRVNLEEKEVPPSLENFLRGAAVCEGAREVDMLASIEFLQLTSPRDINAYTLWQHCGDRYVLMLGNKQGHTEGFRVGRRKGQDLRRRGAALKSAVSRRIY